MSTGRHPHATLYMADAIVDRDRKFSTCGVGYSAALATITERENKRLAFFGLICSASSGSSAGGWNLRKCSRYSGYAWAS
jgi:hypothetical protein